MSPECRRLSFGFRPGWGEVARSRLCSTGPSRLPSRETSEGLGKNKYTAVFSLFPWKLCKICQPLADFGGWVTLCPGGWLPGRGGGGRGACGAPSASPAGLPAPEGAGAGGAKPRDSGKSPWVPVNQREGINGKEPVSSWHPGTVQGRGIREEGRRVGTVRRRVGVKRWTRKEGRGGVKRGEGGDERDAPLRRRGGRAGRAGAAVGYPVRRGGGNR